MFLVLISAVVCDAFDIWMGVAFDALNSATRCWALCPIEEGGTGRPLLVASPSRAHVGRFLPDRPVAPRLPGIFFAILNYQQDRWQCLPADSATSMQLRICDPIGSSLGESSIRARWVYGEPATRCGGFDGRALFR